MTNQMLESADFDEIKSRYHKKSMLSDVLAGFVADVSFAVVRGNLFSHGRDPDVAYRNTQRRSPARYAIFFFGQLRNDTATPNDFLFRLCGNNHTRAG